MASNNSDIAEVGGSGDIAEKYYILLGLIQFPELFRKASKITETRYTTDILSAMLFINIPVKKSHLMLG